MQHKCKVTVIDKKLFPELQAKYLADPASGACPFYEVGQEFVFERYGGKDDFWREGNGTQCAEAWDCISRYIYTALQGGAVMRGWTNDERLMIACCNDGTRPVVFRIERIDYKAVYCSAVGNESAEKNFASALSGYNAVRETAFDRERGFAEIILDKELSDADILAAAKRCGIAVTKID